MQSREENRALFRKAQKGDASANLDIGRHFYHGENDFPKNLLQAKKHFLRAMLNRAQGTIVKSILTFLIKTDQELQSCDNSFFYPLEDALKDTRKIPENSKMLYTEFVKMLEAIEKEHGVFSEYEMEVCQESPASLKNISIRYLVSNLSLFNVTNIQQLPVPVELHEALEEERNRKNPQP